MPCELRTSQISCPSLTTATNPHRPQTFSLFLHNAPTEQNCSSLLCFFPPAYLSYLTVTAPELRGILKPFSFSLHESRKELKALEYVLTDSLSAPSDLLRSRLNWLPYILSLHVCQGRNPHKPHKKALLAAVVTLTSVHQSYHVGMTLVRQGKEHCKEKIK